MKTMHSLHQRVSSVQQYVKSSSMCTQAKVIAGFIESSVIYTDIADHARTRQGFLVISHNPIRLMEYYTSKKI